MPSYLDVLFAKLAVRNGLVDDARIRECFEIQRRGAEVGYEESLPAILVKRAHLTGEDVQKLEKAQAIAQFIRAERLFAKIVVERGFASAAVVKAAFEAARDAGFQKPLGRRLVEQGVLRETQAQQALAEQVRRLSEEADSVVNPFDDAAAAGPPSSEMGEAGADGGDDAPDVSVDPSGSVRLRFGQRLLQSRMITQEQLDECLRLQDALRRKGVRRRLGELLADKKILSRDELRRVADALESSQESLEADPSGRRARAPAGVAPGTGKAKVSDGAKRAQRVVAIRGYDLVARLGQGALGVVYKARRHFDGHPVALKILPPSFAQSEELVARFRAAWKTARSLEHPNVIKLDELGIGGDYAWYTMEYVEGESLDARVRDRGALPQADAVEAARQIALALAHAEKHAVTHRDLRPENVIITPDGLYRIGDVGLSQVLSGLAASSVALAGADPGADRYASPEELQGQPIGPRSHVYSLGLVLFFASTGQHPFGGFDSARWRSGWASGEGLDPREMAAPLGERFASVIQTATAADPERRYSSAVAMLDDIEAIGQRTARVSTLPMKQRDPGPGVRAGAAPTARWDGPDSDSEAGDPRVDSDSGGGWRSLDEVAAEAPAAAANPIAETVLDGGPPPISNDAATTLDGPVPVRSVVPPTVRTRGRPPAGSGVQPTIRRAPSDSDRVPVARSTAAGRPPVPHVPGARTYEDEVPTAKLSAAVTAARRDPIGRVLTDRYRVVERIRTGAAGAVYRAEEVIQKGEVAVTVLAASLAETGRSRETFQRHLRAAASVRHDAVVTVLDAGVEDRTGALYVVSELITGRRLLDVILEEGALSPRRALPMVATLLGGLEAIHAAGLTHGALTPAAIILDAEGKPRIADVGIGAFLADREGARSAVEEDELPTVLGGAPGDDELSLVVPGVPEPWRHILRFRTSLGEGVGVPAYLAPEQATGGGLDARADLYAIGVMLWEMLVGRLPFEERSVSGLVRKQVTQRARDPAEVHPGLAIEPRIGAAIVKALAKDRRSRFSSAAEMRVVIGGSGARGKRSAKKGVGEVSSASSDAFRAAKGTAVMPKPTTPPSRSTRRRPRGADDDGAGGTSALVYVAVGFLIFVVAAAVCGGLAVALLKATRA